MSDRDGTDPSAPGDPAPRREQVVPEPDRPTLTPARAGTTLDTETSGLEV
ncbi:hypothetical protein ACIP88_04445 [Streptomyces uncialis]